MTDSWVMGVMLVAVVAGAVVQRITGMGFALVCAPALVYVLGPLPAVNLANTVAIGLNISIIAVTFQHLNWRKALTISIGAFAAIPLVAVAQRHVSSEWLQTAIGLIVVVAICMILMRRKARGNGEDTRLRRFATGAAAGAMGAAAGLSGPPLAMYAAKVDWHAREFVPTFQLIGIMIALLAITTSPSTHLPASVWLYVIVAIVIGFTIGSALAPRVKSHQVQLGALIVSGVGGAVTFVLGVKSLLT